MLRTTQRGASGPAITRAGSPGSRYAITKVMLETPNSATSIHSTRRTRYLITAVPLLEIPLLIQVEEIGVDLESADAWVHEVVLHAVVERHVAVLRQGQALRLLPERHRLGYRQRLCFVQQRVDPGIRELGHVVAG